jgi:gliding motility-associated-like protein
MRFALQSILGGCLFLMISANGIAQVKVDYRDKSPDESFFQLKNVVGLKPSSYRQNQTSVSEIPKVSFHAPSTSNVNRPDQIDAPAGCSDTSGRFFLKDVAGGSFYIGDYIRARDGNLLIAGQYVINNAGNLVSKGFLMKCDEDGSVLWNRLYSNLNSANSNDFIFYYKLIELGNGNILLAGSTLDFVTQNNALIITTTDQSGNLVWSKIYKSRLWAYGYQSANYYYVQQIIQDKQSGNIFIAGRHWTEGRSVINMNPSNGNILWSNLYQPSDGGQIDDPFGLDIHNNQLLLFGHFLTADGARISVYSLNKSTGDTFRTRFYKISGDVTGKNRFVVINPLVKLNNGHYALTGEQYGYNTASGDTESPYHAGYIELDNNLNFVTAYSFRNNMPGKSTNTMITVFPDGSGLFTMLQYVSSYTGLVYYVQFRGGEVLNQRVKLYSGKSVPNANPSLELNNGGVLEIKSLADSLKHNADLEFLKLHTSDSSSQCLGITDNSTFTEPFYLEQAAGSIDSLGRNVFQENTNKDIAIETASLSYSPGCQQISFCNSLSLSSSSTSICGGDSVRITVHTNPGCTGSVFFTLDSSKLESISGLDDSDYLFKFRSSWQGTIYATLRGCNNLVDSVQIVSPAIQSSSDTGFCRGSSVNLDAGAGFSSYQWSNGSANQSIDVSIAGDYSVKTTTTDGCTATDTIKVKEFAPPVSALDKNRALCLNQVTTLDAGDFSSYLWSTGDTSRTIEVGSLGVYFVTIKDNHGCTATDTVNIDKTALAPTKILPADSSVCNYRPTVLTPLKDFKSYWWSSGETAKSITVYQPGIYWLQVTDDNNCQGRDSIVLSDEGCGAGFFIPNAFTPNNDGTNDRFKPLLFGPVDHYEFIIYNRAGEVVFKSDSVDDSWDGKFKNVPQDTGVFVWICKYKFAGKDETIEKGTLMLLR